MEPYRVRVIYGDTDQMGVVYYANYFRYFEASRSEYFRARGGDYAQMEKQGLMLPVIEAVQRHGLGAMVLSDRDLPALGRLLR